MLICVCLTSLHTVFRIQVFLQRENSKERATVNMVVEYGKIETTHIFPQHLPQFGSFTALYIVT